MSGGQKSTKFAHFCLKRGNLVIFHVGRQIIPHNTQVSNITVQATHRKFHIMGVALNWLKYVLENLVARPTLQDFYARLNRAL